MKTALLVIDVQMAFVQDDANGASRSIQVRVITSRPYFQNFANAVIK